MRIAQQRSGSGMAMGRVLVFLLLTMLVAFTSCSDQAPKSVAPLSPTPIQVSPSPDALSETKLRVFAERLESALQKSDSAAVYQLVDEAAFVERATRAAPNFKIAARAAAGARAIAALPMGIFSYTGFTEWKLLKARVDNREGRILFAADAVGGGGYVEARVETRDGKFRVVDIALYLRRQTLSLDVATLTTALVAQKDDTESRYRAYTKLATDGKFAEARKIHQTFPPAVQKQALVELSQLAMSNSMDSETHIRDLEHYVRNRAPDSPKDEFDLILVYLTGSNDDLVRSIREVRDRVGFEDPTLDFQEAIALTRAGRAKEGRAVLVRTQQRAPDYVEVEWGFMKIALFEGDFEEAIIWLDRLMVRYPDLPQQVRQREDCQAFIKSPQGRKWIERALENP